MVRNSPYLADALAGFFTGGVFFTGEVFFVPFVEAGLTACLLVDEAGCCFTTGEAKEMPPKRRAPARIKLNFFMTFNF
jgi:hypothetical protein